MKACDQPVLPLEMREYRAYLLRRQHDRQSLRSLGPDDVVEPGKLNTQHLAIEKEESGQRLALSRSRHATIDREMGEERFDLRVHPCRSGFSCRETV